MQSKFNMIALFGALYATSASIAAIFDPSNQFAWYLSASASFTVAVVAFFLSLAND